MYLPYHIECLLQTYLGTISDIDTTFIECWANLDLEELYSFKSGISRLELLRMKNAGSDGTGSVTEKLLSI